jgi:hypothetical protein
MNKQCAPKGEKPIAYKIADAAHLLSVSPASVRRLIHRGDLVAIRKLRHVLVTAESVRRLAGIEAPDSKGAKSAALAAS